MIFLNKELIIVLHSLAVGGAERRLCTFASFAAEKGYDVTMLLIDNPYVKFVPDKRVKVVCVNQSPDLSEYDETKCKLLKMNKLPEITAFENVKLHLLKIFNKKEAEYFEEELYLKKKNAEPLFAYLKNKPNATVISFMTMPNISLMMAAQHLPNKVLFGDCIDVKTEYPPESPYCEMRKRYFGRAAGAIFQTPDESDYYTFLPDLKKYVIPNFIKGELFPERYTGERKKEIVNFCRLSPAKDLPLLIDAFLLFHKDYPEYTLKIYGEGGLKDELLKKISDLGLEKSAFILPFDKELHPKIKDAAMYVSSSYREGISNSMLEALATGLPCVCTDCAGGGARMMIEDHKNGLLVPMHDAKALCNAMKEIIETPGLSEKLSKNAVKIKDRLKPEKICDEMLTAIFGEN